MIAELTREIEEGPGGPEIGAFFDLDRTLIAGFSVVAFVQHGVTSGMLGPGALGEILAAAASFQLGTIGYSAFLVGSSRILRGVEEKEFAAAGQRIFEERLAAEIYPESRALVNAHLRKGHTVAVVSSATDYQVAPVARDMGIPDVLASRLEVREGRFTGEPMRPLCYGEGKAIHAGALAEQRGVDLRHSYFYTDSDEDLPLLDAVGCPRPINPNRRLASIAAKRGWPSRYFHSRGAPGMGDVLRTGLGLASLVPSFLLGLPAAALSGNWQQAVNLAASTWGELGTALSGIEVRVLGEQHLWSHRPAVFIFNHQSGIDPLVLCKLLRRDFVGIGKQEIRRHPIFGPFFAAAGTVFIDRFDHSRAVEGLRPAIEALRSGLSLAIAPEGTRSTTATPGRFKKGAFHLAMNARVPIVPIVFHNAIDALPKHAYFVRPTTVDVRVLPPISTDGWTRDTLEDRIAEVRQLYLDELGR